MVFSLFSDTKTNRFNEDFAISNSKKIPNAKIKLGCTFRTRQVSRLNSFFDTGTFSFFNYKIELDPCLAVLITSLPFLLLQHWFTTVHLTILSLKIRPSSIFPHHKTCRLTDFVIVQL